MTLYYNLALLVLMMTLGSSLRCFPIPKFIALSRTSFFVPIRKTTTACYSNDQRQTQNLSNGMENPSGPVPNDRKYSNLFDGENFPESINYKPIAIVASPFKERHGAPRQPATEGLRGEANGSIRLLTNSSSINDINKAKAMMDDIDSFSHIIVLSHLHLNTGWSARVTPPRLRHLNNQKKKKGILATRSPHRPNNIGMSVLKLCSVDRENLELQVKNIDLIDGTPVLDIKPYIRQYDSFPTASSGWVDDLEILENRGDMAKVMHDSGAEEKKALDHRKSYSITAKIETNNIEIKSETGCDIFTQTSKNISDIDTAPQPVELLLAAMIRSAQETAMFVSRSINLNIIRMDFDVHAYRDERGKLHQPIEEMPHIPSRLQYISAIVKVFVEESKAPTTIEDLKLLGEQTKARCPVTNMMIASGCIIDIKWIDGNS